VNYERKKKGVPFYETWCIMCSQTSESLQSVNFKMTIYEELL